MKVKKKRLYIRDYFIKQLLLFFASIALIITIGLFIALFLESKDFFKFVNVFDFLFGGSWSPYFDGEESSGFGLMPLWLGTLRIAFVALVIAFFFGLSIAVYLFEYATPKTRNTIKPLLELFAGIPTLVYGFITLIVIGPFLNWLGSVLHIEIQNESALAVGIAMGFMILPYVTALAEDALNSLPSGLKEGGLALGAFPSEVLVKILIPASLPTLAGAFLLAVGRAISETMIVVMAAGLTAKYSFSLLESASTFTVQILNALQGDVSFNDPRSTVAFALGLVLFVTTLILNMFALKLMKRKI